MPALLRSFFAPLALLALASAPTLAAESFSTTAPTAILIDTESHAVLFEKNADDLTSPASTVKIMTAELVFREIQEGRINLDTKFTVSEHAWRTGGAGAGGSSMFAQLNSQIRVEDLIRGLVVQSGNDAAIVFAEQLAGSESAFGDMMTKRARELGMEKSNFRNPWGRFDPNQKVTAREMAMLAEHVIRTYPDLYKYFAEKEFTWNKIRQANRNPLLFMELGADGLKTGYIEDSGYGLVGSAVQNGQRLIVVVNGCKTAKERAEEARKLLQWGFRAFEAKQIFAAGEQIGSAKVYGGERGDVPLLASTSVKILLPRGSGEKLSGRIVYEGPLIAPVEEGKQVARLKIMRGQTLALDLPLTTGDSVAVGSLPHRAMDAGLEYATILFRKYVSKKDK
ncbi:MAG: D-alanyl-D-alanine carboxypeptidase [Methylobacteriaceae bacterium]|nr:D-alanyl-D-alanine carboxypeptidase [Methylobacteriaceae bacterium]